MGLPCTVPSGLALSRGYLFISIIFNLIGASTTQSSQGCISPDLHNITLWFYAEKVPLSNKLSIALILWLEVAAVKRQEIREEVFMIALLGLNISN